MGELFCISGYDLRLPSYQSNPITDLDRVKGLPDTPRILYVPAASGDNLDYYENFKKVYQSQHIGASTTCVLLSKGYDVETLKIEDYDGVMIGGGSTELLAKTFLTTGFNKRLRKFYNSGGSIAGVSAGANILCSASITNKEKPINGLGLIEEFSIFPHYTGEDLTQYNIDSFSKTEGIPLFGLPDFSAIKYKNNSYKIHIYKEAMLSAYIAYKGIYITENVKKGIYLFSYSDKNGYFFEHIQ